MVRLRPIVGLLCLAGPCRAARFLLDCSDFRPTESVEGLYERALDRIENKGSP